MENVFVLEDSANKKTPCSDDSYLTIPVFRSAIRMIGMNQEYNIVATGRVSKFQISDDFYATIDERVIILYNSCQTYVIPITDYIKDFICSSGITKDDVGVKLINYMFLYHNDINLRLLFMKLKFETTNSLVDSRYMTMIVDVEKFLI